MTVINQNTLRRFSAVLYAFGHFLVDFSCALMMRSTLPEPVYFLVYNFCAFAMQMPIGLIADISGRSKPFAMIGFALVLAAGLPFPVPLRVVLMGIGNACYHVGGGREALLTDRKMTGLGIFVSPGALGIWLGAVFADNAAIHALVCAGLIVTAIAVYFLCSGDAKKVPIGSPKPALALLMLTVVIIRSLIGMSMEAPWKFGIYIALSAVAGAAGKAAGGFLGDRFGRTNTGSCR